jgi:anaerobic ribonucleoside-triphosphate reductase
MNEEKKECIESLEPIHCHDCGKELKTGDEMVVYDMGEKGNFYKCNECFAKKEELDNYQNCEVYSRVVGYIRPVDQWNVGKAEEYKDRQEFNPGENGTKC